jgi:hypothetical protein
VQAGAVAPKRFRRCGPGEIHPELADYVGAYDSPELGESHVITMSGDHLEVRLESPLRRLVWRRLKCCGPDIFVAPIDGEPSMTNVSVRFERDSHGQICALSYTINRAARTRFIRRSHC